MAGVDEVHLEKLLSQLQQLKSELDREVGSLHPHAEAEERSPDKGLVPTSDIEQYQERIKQVEQALNKIDINVHGYCASCGAPITEHLTEEPETPEFCSNCRA
ncbi:MAG: hypothetical protein ACPF9K_00315 [Neptuniibacter sp.]